MYTTSGTYYEEPLASTGESELVRVKRPIRARKILRSGVHKTGNELINPSGLISFNSNQARSDPTYPQCRAIFLRFAGQTALALN